jgi:hypothetical protein
MDAYVDARVDGLCERYAVSEREDTCCSARARIRMHFATPVKCPIVVKRGVNA